jgi:hypothetical protein
MDKQSLEIALRPDSEGRTASLITEPFIGTVSYEATRLGCWLTDTESGKVRWIDRTEIDFVRSIPASTVSRLQIMVPAG